MRKAIDIAPSTEIPLKLEQAIIQQNCFLMNIVEIRLESFKIKMSVRLPRLGLARNIALLKHLPGWML